MREKNRSIDRDIIIARRIHTPRDLVFKISGIVPREIAAPERLVDMQSFSDEVAR